MAKRRVSFDKSKLIGLKKIYGKEPHVIENTSIWIFESNEKLNNNDIKYDDNYLDENFIIITPMTIDENENNLMQKLKEKMI